jgi:hypothetical protein
MKRRADTEVVYFLRETFKREPGLDVDKMIHRESGVELSKREAVFVNAIRGK